MQKEKSCSRLEVRRKPGGDPSNGLMAINGRTIPCKLGRSGITTRKFEGDGATPRGRFRLLWGTSKSKYKVASPLEIQKTGKLDGWCDDPAHPAYNRPVRLPFSGSHEKMWRGDRLYDICIILDYNIHPCMRHRGSAIFFHLTNIENKGTEGCIAVDPEDMRRLLPCLSSTTILHVKT